MEITGQIGPSESFEEICLRALREYGSTTLRGVKVSRPPTIGEAFAVAYRLRSNGNAETYAVAQRIEKALIRAVSGSIGQQN